MTPTIAIVREYLEMLDQEDIAGIRNNVHECPVARAMHWKYPRSGSFAVTTYSCYIGSMSGQNRSPNPPEIVEFIEAVDFFGGSTREEKPITRRDIEQILRGD